jgi:Pentapeptide repeats (9 copies)
LEVDADFVNGWLSRITTDADGYKRLPVTIAMQHTTMVDALVLHRYELPRGLMLQGLKADAVRIGESTISGGMSLDSAEIEDEVSLQKLSLDSLSLVALRARILWLLDCQIERQVDARSLTLDRGLHLRRSEIGESANFRDSRLGQPQYNVTISGNFRSTADFTDCVFPGETQVGRYADLPPSIFEGPTLFEGSTFGGEDFGAVSFRECKFQGRVSFKNVKVYGGVSFSAATSQAPADLTGLNVRAAPHCRGEDVSLYPARAFDFTSAVVNSDLNLRAVVDGDASIQDVSLGSLSARLSRFMLRRPPRHAAPRGFLLEWARPANLVDIGRRG